MNDGIVPQLRTEGNRSVSLLHRAGMPPRGNHSVYGIFFFQLTWSRDHSSSWTVTVAKLVGRDAVEPVVAAEAGLALNGLDPNMSLDTHEPRSGGIGKPGT